jgi:RNA-directed DNA polymerase
MMESHHQRPSGIQRMNTAKHEERQIAKVSTKEEILTKHLMEKICESTNLNRAYKRVKANKGAAGVDGMTVNELSAWIAKHKESLIESLLSGTYQPQKVLGVEISKPGNKGTRLLGIPSVVDRLVQQAICQVLELIFDTTMVFDLDAAHIKRLRKRKSMCKKDMK